MKFLNDLLENPHKLFLFIILFIILFIPVVSTPLVYIKSLQEQPHSKEVHVTSKVVNKDSINSYIEKEVSTAKDKELRLTDVSTSSTNNGTLVVLVFE